MCMGSPDARHHDGDALPTATPDAEHPACAPAAESILSREVYAHLHDIARMLMSQERHNHTLQATALVHEAYARLAREMGSQWANTAECYHSAARAMRRILVDHARRRSAVKRGGDWSRASLEHLDLASEGDCGQLLALDEAIVRLEQEDARAAEVVRLRFYAGLTVDQTATAMGQSRRTILRDWEFARAWLLEQLQHETT